MPYDPAGLLGHQRDAEDTSLTQRINDELLRVVCVRCVQECRDRYGMDLRNIGRCFFAYYCFHRTNLSHAANSNSAAQLLDNTANLMYESGFGEQEASEFFRSFSKQGRYPYESASTPGRTPEATRPGS